MTSKMKLASMILIAVPCAVSAQLYGVSTDLAGNNAFNVINTTTGAATNQFNFSIAGINGVQALTYCPGTGKFITTGIINAFNSALIEIDAGAMTATVVGTGIPSLYFEGIEYYTAGGGLAVSHGPGGFFSGSLCLLNQFGYGLMANNAATTLPDGDTLFEDSAGDLNVEDWNNPAPNGFMRNRVNSPFGVSSLTGIGANMYVGNESDYAWKADENKLFVTQQTTLGWVNAPSTVITTIGGYGTNSDGSAIRMTGITALAVPEPSTWAALGLGVLFIARRRRRT